MSVDFVALFHERLQAIEPMDVESEDYGARLFLGDDVKPIKRRAAALVMTREDTAAKVLELWVQDLTKIRRWPHVHVDTRESLLAHDEAWQLVDNLPIAAWIIEDSDGRLFLVGDGTGWSWTMEDLKEFESIRLPWFDLMDRYGLGSVSIASFEVKTRENEPDAEYETSSRSGYEITEYLGEDLLGQWRQEEHIAHFTKERDMTTSQKLRFRLFVNELYRPWDVLVDYAIHPPDA